MLVFLVKTTPITTIPPRERNARNSKLQFLGLAKHREQNYIEPLSLGDKEGDDDKKFQGQGN